MEWFNSPETVVSGYVKTKSGIRKFVIIRAVTSWNSLLIGVEGPQSYLEDED